MSNPPVAGRRSAAPSPRAVGVVPALLAEPQEDGSVLCNVCAMRCLVRPGRTGICGVRENRDGVLDSACLRPCSRRRDRSDREEAALPRRARLPAPSRSRRPAARSSARSARTGRSPRGRASGSTCRRAAVPRRRSSHEARSPGRASIAYTYVEPTVFLEYALDTAREARAAGLLNCPVTDGYATPRGDRPPAALRRRRQRRPQVVRRRLLPRQCGARLAPVLDALRAYAGRGRLAGGDDAGHPRPQRRLRRAPCAGRLDRDRAGPGDAVARQPLLPGPPDDRRAAHAPRDPAPGCRHRARGRAGPRLRRQRTTARAGGHPLRRLRTVLLERRGYRVFDRLGPDGSCPSCGRALAGRALDHDGRVPCG